MIKIALVVFAYIAIGFVCTVAKDDDPCGFGFHRNITHLNERYSKLTGDCPYTDHHIGTEWFYAGSDPIVTFPPDYCSCGYKFPIWMNGTLPSPEDGIVDRQACRKFIQSCHETLTIQVKNCGTFFVYHLTPGPDDSGFCFGIDKPEPDKEHVEKVTVTINNTNILANSFVTVFNVSSQDVNVTAELLLSNSSVIKVVNIDIPLMSYEWDNLYPSTNYTVHICSFKDGQKLVLIASWVRTEPTYKPANVNIDIQLATITNHSFDLIISSEHGSENTTASGSLNLQNGSVVRSFNVDIPIVTKSFYGLTQGTKYIVEVHTYRNGERKELGQEMVFTQPGIEANLESIITAKGDLSYSSFRCKFNPSPDVVYTVRWKVHRSERNFTIIKTGERFDGIHGLSLTEKDLVTNHIPLPFKISCSVTDNSTGSTFSVESSIVFAGIEILTPSISMYRNETANIRFSPTVPLGCNMPTNGNLTMAITIPVSNNCSGLSTRKCTISVSRHAGFESSLQIQATEDGQYGVMEEKTYKVFLKTAGLQNNSICNGYILPPITVKVKPETDTYWRGKRCEALNDPHMYTFDGQNYEHHESFSDEYVLYTHTSYDVKVLHKVERCNRNATCNCGIAIQAGKDIYIISTCDKILEIGYKQCDDGVLLVRQESDASYTVYLPYGTYVKARLDRSPYSNGSLIVSVSVYPSVHDQHGRSRGLCGSLDNDKTNDYHDRTGQTGLNRTQFINSWTVSKEESLFKKHVYSAVPWHHPACTCSFASGHVPTQDKCRLGADNTCTKGRTVGEQTCKIAEKISIWNSNKLTVPVLDLSKDGNHKDDSTKTEPSVFKTTQSTETKAHTLQSTTLKQTENWSHSKAKTFCSGYMNSSRAFRLCARVPYTDTERAVETCTQDIVITQKTEWHRLSRQSMQDSCISEIHRNKTVREDLERPQQPLSTTTQTSGQHIGSNTTSHPDSDVKDSNLNIYEIVDAIEEIACPNECSDQGICKNGTCKCNDGFGGDDCSIDFKTPPSTASLLHGSTCDEKETKCTHVFIYGGFFASESVACHITTYEMHADKIGRTNLDAYVIRGQTQSLIEVICPLEAPIRRKRSLPDTRGVKLLSCYRVSVSNDGIHHGAALDMCVYNSECQTLSNRSDNMLFAKIKNGYCFIDGYCIPNGDKNPLSEGFCIPEISLYSWSELPTSTVTPGTTSAVFVTHLQSDETSPWKTPVIIAVLCLCTACIITGLVIYIRKTKRRVTEDKKTEKEDFAVNYKHDADFDEETYAHINPIHISDTIAYDKSIKLTDDYSRLDMTKKEKVHYAKLNAIGLNGKTLGPALPERSNDNNQDPYEKLQSTNQDQRVYAKMHQGYNATEADRYARPRLSEDLEKENNYFVLGRSGEKILTPAESNGLEITGLSTNISGVRNREDDSLEGYERPDPHYKQYKLY